MGEPERKPLGARMRASNNLKPHMVQGPGIEPGRHWLVVTSECFQTLPSPPLTFSQSSEDVA